MSSRKITMGQGTDAEADLSGILSIFFKVTEGHAAVRRIPVLQQPLGKSSRDSEEERWIPQILCKLQML